MRRGKGSRMGDRGVAGAKMRPQRGGHRDSATERRPQRFGRRSGRRRRTAVDRKAERIRCRGTVTGRRPQRSRRRWPRWIARKAVCSSRLAGDVTLGVDGLAALTGARCRDEGISVEAQERPDNENERDHGTTSAFENVTPVSCEAGGDGVSTGENVVMPCDGGLAWPFRGVAFVRPHHAGEAIGLPHAATKRWRRSIGASKDAKMARKARGGAEGGARSSQGTLG